MDLNTVEQSSFEPHIGSTFRVIDADAVYPLKLVEVRAGVSNSRTVQYSLFLHGPHSPILPQGMHKFEHDQLGSMELFMVPVGQDSTSVQYEIVFSRLLENR